MVVAASVCDHIVPHKGNKELFFAGPFQSLCKKCHDGTKQRLEKSGEFGCDDNGFPKGWQ